MFLAETTTASRREWIATLTKLKDLDPLHVVAGHNQPDGTDDPTDIDDSIQYLTDFNDADTRTTTPTDLHQAVLQEHPPAGQGIRPRGRAVATLLNGTGVARLAGR
jgi:hypothetical protein